MTCDFFVRHINFERWVSGVNDEILFEQKQGNMWGRGGMGPVSAVGCEVVGLHMNAGARKRQNDAGREECEEWGVMSARGMNGDGDDGGEGIAACRRGRTLFIASVT